MAVIYLVAWEDSRDSGPRGVSGDVIAGIIEQKYDSRQEPGFHNLRLVFTCEPAANIVSHIQAEAGEKARVLVSQVELAGLEGFLSKATWRWVNSRIGRLVPATEI